VSGTTYTITDNRGGSPDGTDTLIDIENVQFADGTFAIGSIPTTITGTNGDDNPLNGTAGDDIINALNGNDSIYGLAGNDTIDGGGGTDTVYYSGDADEFTIDASGGTITVIDDQPGTNGDEGTDILTNVEILNFNGTNYDISSFVTSGTSGEDVIIGTSGDDNIFGDSEEDVIFGGRGNDIFRW
jgi:Ca2+-binding RTX toxin-like protein